MELKRLSHASDYNMWTTPMPRMNKSRLSPSFRVSSYTWQFELKTTLDESLQSEMWNLRLYRRDTRYYNAVNFLISILVRNRDGSFESMACHKVIGFHAETLIWYEKQSSLASQHKHVDFSGASMTFLFLFDFGVQDFLTGSRFGTIKEHKSVQTSFSVEDRPGSLSLDLRKMMGEGSNPDLQIKCGTNTFPAHRFILCARSEVFQAMLKSDMLEGLEGSIEIADMESEVFELFLQYLYTDALPELTVDTALPLYEASDKYRLEGLMRQCRDFLAENMSSANACEILVMADAHSDKDLKESAVSFLSTENIPGKKEEWTSFSHQHPNLACEVLFRALEGKTKIS